MSHFHARTELQAKAAELDTKRGCTCKSCARTTVADRKGRAPSEPQP